MTGNHGYARQHGVRICPRHPTAIPHTPGASAPAWRERSARPIARVSPKRLPHAAWDLADEMGWAKTYDANDVALARLLGCRLVTLDARLRRGTARLGIVVGPTEL